MHTIIRTCVDSLLAHATRAKVTMTRNQAMRLLSQCAGFRSPNAWVAAHQAEGAQSPIDQLLPTHTIATEDGPICLYRDAHGVIMGISPSTTPVIRTDSRGYPVILMPTPGSHTTPAHASIHTHHTYTLTPWDDDAPANTPDLTVQADIRPSDITLRIPTGSRSDAYWSCTVENDNGTPTLRVYNDAACDEPLMILTAPRDYAQHQQLTLTMDKESTVYGHTQRPWRRA